MTKSITGYESSIFRKMNLQKFNLKVNALGRFSMSPWKGAKYEIINKNIKNLPNWLALKKKTRRNIN